MIIWISGMIDKILSSLDRMLVVEKRRIQWEPDTCSCVITYQVKRYMGGYLKECNFNALKWCKEHSNLDCFSAAEAAREKNLTVNEKILKLKEEVQGESK